MPMMDFASLRVSYHHTQLTIHICRLAVQGLSWSLIQQQQQQVKSSQVCSQPGPKARGDKNASGPGVGESGLRASCQLSTR